MEKLILKKDKRIKGGGEIESIVILGIDDLDNPQIWQKTRGLKIDILYVPKQIKNIFKLTDCFNQLYPNLMANSHTGKGEIRYY